MDVWCAANRAPYHHFTATYIAPNWHSQGIRKAFLSQASLIYLLNTSHYPVAYHSHADTFFNSVFYTKQAQLKLLMSEMSNANSAEAALVITEAVERFRDSISPDDQAQIEGTGLKDVVNALLSIQKDLQQRRENRNLRKLYPFVQGLERYSGAIDTLSNGLSPYLPYIWAPIKLMLRITSDYLGAFDKLIEAYGRIAETMPRLKKLSDAFKDNPTLLTKLALYYADVLEFHRRAYKFLAWQFFFSTTWARFDFRFNSILASMAKNSEAIDQEAATIDIIEAKQWRDKLASQVDTREQDRADRQRQSVISWLALEHPPQDDNREKLLRDCLPGSCDWVLKQDKMASWVKVDSRLAVVWMHGKPGAGKSSVICATLVNSLEDSDVTTFSYFCKYHQDDTSSQILKALVLKIIESSPDFSAMVFSEFVQKHREPSLRVLRTMLTGSKDKLGLLHGIPTCRIVIDGLDECNPKEQKYVLEDLLQLVSVNSRGGNCKLLISSRDIPEISSVLRKKMDIGVISLSNERDSLNRTIQLFIENRLRYLVGERKSLHIGDKIVEDIVDIMINKADGMFLWAKLVLDSLLEVDSIRELHAAITSMPRELPQLYARILKALARDGRTDKVMKVLAWLAFVKRPLKRHELLHGISITPETHILNKWDVLDGSVIDKCKPLVEELPDGSIALIHFTVEEYLRTDCSIQRLDPTVWEEAIAFACVTVLKGGLCLLDPKLPKLSQLLQILSGSFALLLYAVDFWLDHVLACASIAKLPEMSLLAQALASLKLLHNQLCSILKHNASSKDSLATPVSTDSRLEALSHLSVYSICASILTLRADCKDKSASNGQEFEELTLERDSTLFSTLAAQFNESVRQLLSENFTSNDIPKDQLDRFRNQYLQFSFRCRFTPCTRASLGFASEALRVSHEQLHVKRLFCDKPNCSRGRIGFRHQRDLDIHERTYHEEGSILVPPRVRKMFSSHTVATELLAISNIGEQFSSDRNSQAALFTTTQQDVKKFKTLLPFEVDKIEETLSKWRESRSSKHNFAVLLNEKLKSRLDVNLIHTFNHTSVTCDVDISPDDRLVAAGCDRLIRVFDIHSGEEKYNFEIDASNIDGIDYVRAIRFSCDGHYLVSASEDGYIRIWPLRGSGRQPKVFKAHENGINGLALAPDGHTVITVGGDGAVRVWDLQNKTTLKLRMTFSVEDSVQDVAVSPDSRLVACTDPDKSISIWNIQTNNLLQRFTAHEKTVWSVEFSPDGQTLISTSLDNSIMIWEVYPADIQNFDSLEPLKQMKLHQSNDDKRSLAFI
ncbi:hypothetical protein NUW58_g3702 [Xylaria curta]|uniref:Uncharacterized protein n=1 Tax=Xylaria curta TaxID=42375 RepID=A0ACC1PC31_9PEZI|nr:hypothetical protein NUW58_g3702 [Xylaria curta]